MKPATYIPHSSALRSLPRAPQRNGEGPVKGQARLRGSLRTPLTEPSPFHPKPLPRKRKKKTKH
jgi:hypothetical protein